jgi:hypothetical protein
MTKQPAGRTPVRNVRVHDEVWNTALANARAEGKTITEVIIGCLKRYNAATARRREREGKDEQ